MLDLTRFAEMHRREQTLANDVDLIRRNECSSSPDPVYLPSWRWACCSSGRSRTPGGWAGFALLIVGLFILDVAALRWGADSRDGRNWTNGRGLTPGANQSIDQKFVEAEIARIEHQFRRKG